MINVEAVATDHFSIAQLDHPEMPMRWWTAPSREEARAMALALKEMEPASMFAVYRQHNEPDLLDR